MVTYQNDIANCLTVLQSGGIILYPTDTIWGLGCDATNEAAVKKIFSIKKRSESKSLIILVANEEEISNYTKDNIFPVLNYLKNIAQPTTVIYRKAMNLAASAIHTDGSIAIRIVKDEFCRELIQQFGKPIISTSANVSEQPNPHNFSEISTNILDSVDYKVQYRQHEMDSAKASKIISINEDGSIHMIRP